MLKYMAEDKHSEEHREIRSELREVKKDVKDTRHDIVSVEKKIDTIVERTERLENVPTRDEFPELLRKTF